MNKKSLLCSISAVAFMSFMAQPVMATEISDSDTISATDATGLLESNEIGTVTVTIDSNTAGITLGADSVNAVEITESSAATDLILKVEQSGAANGVVFAGDIDANGHADDTIVINVLNDNVTFQGNIESTVGTTAADINLGSGAANPTILMTVDTVNNENLTIEATIDAVDAADTANLKISNSDSGNANTVTFSNAIGAAEALDSIDIDANTTVIFNDVVKAGDIKIATENDTVFNGDVTGDITISNEGALRFSSAAVVTGDIFNTSGNYGRGDIYIDENVTLTGNVGQDGGVDGLTVGEVVIADGKALTLNSGGTRFFSSEIEFKGETAELNLNGTGIDVSSGLIADEDGFGVVNILEDTTFSANFGETSEANGSVNKALSTVTIADGKTATISSSRFADLGINVNNFIIQDSAGDDAGLILQTGTTEITIQQDIQIATAGGNGLITVQGVTLQGSTGKLDLNGDIGTATHSLGKLTWTDNQEAIVIASGNLYIDDIDVEGTLSFDNSADIVVSGSVDSFDAGQSGKVETSGTGNVTFNSKLGANELLSQVKTNSGSQLTLSDTVAAATLENNGTITFDADENQATTATFAEGSTINIGSNVNANEVVLKTATVTDIASGQVTVNLPSSFAVGETIALFEDTDSNVADSGVALTDFKLEDNVFTKYDLALGSTVTATGSLTGDDTQWVVSAAEKTIPEIAASLDINIAQASALKIAHDDALTSGDATALSAINSVVASGKSTSADAARSLAVQEEILDGASASAIRTGAKSLNAISDHLASLRSGGQYAGHVQEGLATGDEIARHGAWTKAFGNWASQDEKDGVAGYDADTAGVAFGLDTEITSNIRLGGAFSYAVTDVDGDGAGNAQLDIDSYQLSVYGDYTTESYYIEASLGYAMNENESTRQVNFGGINRTANADYDSDQFMVSIAGGMPMHLEGDTFITPMAGLSYTHVSIDNYTETGAGNLNLNIDSDDVESAIASLGVKFHKTITQGNGVLIPSVNFGVSYDLAGDEAEATASYTGGGASFVAEGAEVEEFGINLGFGVGYEDDQWALTLNYDTEFKSDYNSHSAVAEARYKF